MKHRILAETAHYALIRWEEGQQGHSDLPAVGRTILQTMETLRTDGYQALHYVPRLQAWVCAKSAAKQDIKPEDATGKSPGKKAA